MHRTQGFVFGLIVLVLSSCGRETLIEPREPDLVVGEVLAGDRSIMLALSSNRESFVTVSVHKESDFRDEGITNRVAVQERNQTSITVKDLENGRDYHIRVRAEGPDGEIKNWIKVPNGPYRPTSWGDSGSPDNLGDADNPGDQNDSMPSETPILVEAVLPGDGVLGLRVKTVPGTYVSVSAHSAVDFTDAGEMQRVQVSGESHTIEMTGLRNGSPYYLRVQESRPGEEGKRWTEVPGNPHIPFPFVPVEGGSFLMGGYEGEEDEKPAHLVTVSSFSISKYEVTNREYTEFMNLQGVLPDGTYLGEKFIDLDSPYVRVYYANGSFHYNSIYGDHPVVKVTWYGARAYSEWLGGRLPTEAEWEYAAKGGSRSQGYEYAGSNNPDEVAWYEVNNQGGIHSVGEKLPNELGLYDISGNVQEWCSDWYGSYASEASTDPQGPDEPQGDSYRIYRGGGWYSGAPDIRSSKRVGRPPWSGDDDLGFRPVLKLN